MKKFIGIDVGGTKCAVVLGDSNGNILEKKKFDTRGSSGEVLSRIIQETNTIMDNNGARGSVVSAGISCGGPLDPDSGVILSPPNLPGWDSVPVTSIVSEALGFPVYLQNDADAGALAEWTWGAGKNLRNLVFLTFGTGIGAGIILNGSLYHGSNGTAGEVGHIRLAEDGPEGYGKRGSFEGFCSGGGIASMANARSSELRRAGLTPSLPSSYTARDIGEGASNGNSAALEILSRSGKYLGRGIAILIDILNPEMIIIGSIFIRCEKYLRPSMERAIREEALSRSAEICRIVPAGLGESIGDYAALGVAVNGCSGRGTDTG